MASPSYRKAHPTPRMKRERLDGRFARNKPGTNVNRRTFLKKVPPFKINASLHSPKHPQENEFACTSIRPGRVAHLATSLLDARGRVGVSGRSPYTWGQLDNPLRTSLLDARAGGMPRWLTFPVILTRLTPLLAKCRALTEPCPRTGYLTRNMSLQRRDLDE